MEESSNSATNGATPFVLTNEDLTTAREKLESLKLEKDWKEPDRGDLNSDEMEWRDGKPNFSLANLTYFTGRSKNHGEGSLELLVENVVKKWEMEASHKVNYRQWETINHDRYQTSANGGRVFHGEKSAERGNYNMLLDACPKDLYDATKETFESSMLRFKTAFPTGFVWELLELYSGPPKLVFSWRHWGHFVGMYKNRTGTGELLEMFGLCEVIVDEQLKICSIEVFYKPDEFLMLLEGKLSPGATSSTSEAFRLNAAASACPFKHAGSSIPADPVEPTSSTNGDANNINGTSSCRLT